MTKRLAAFVPNVLGVSPGQRVRIETWASCLRARDWAVEFYPFENGALHDVLYRPGHSLAKVRWTLACYGRQLRTALRRTPCDAVFIYREAALIGPAVVERLAARWKVPIIYDLDDPVFLPYSSPANGLLSYLKCSRKTHTLLRMSTCVLAINDIIAEYVSRYNSNVHVVPNSIDTIRYQPKRRTANGQVRLGWIGSYSSMSNLQTICRVLQRVQRDCSAVVRVIGAGQFQLPGVCTEDRRWSMESEVADLQECDIGMVPLIDHPWNPWKFFFKTIQYMAVGIPVVARKMGSNEQVVQDGVNGFLVETEQEWYDRLRLLIEQPHLRARMGQAARETVESQFALAAQQQQITAIFDEALAEKSSSRVGSR